APMRVQCRLRLRRRRAAAKQMTKLAITTARTMSLKRTWLAAFPFVATKGKCHARHAWFDETSPGHAGKNAGNSGRNGADRGRRASRRRHGPGYPYRQGPDESTGDR